MVVYNNVLAGAAGQGGAADQTILRSLRFNDNDSAYLSRTPSSAGNRKTWTYSTWCKQATPEQAGILLNAQNGTSQGFANNFWILFYAGTLVVGDGSTDFLNTNKLRDPSAWYHIVVACDTTQSSASDRLKIYINGVESDYTGDARSSISQNSDTTFNSTYLHRIGDSGSYHAFFDGYLAETHLVDGQALAPTKFGKYDDNGIWNPIVFSGSHGTNGFYLDYSDNSSDSALGNDAAGSNNWTVNNLTATTTTTNWASQLSVNNSSNSISNPGDAFDGDLTTYARLNLESGGDRGIVWTPATTTTVSSSLRVYWKSWTSTQYNNGYVYVNGQSQGQVPSNLNGWYTVAYTGTITTMELRSQYNSGGGHHIDWVAIEIDGNIVKDPGLEAIDSVLDSPTNYDDGTNIGGNYCTFNYLQNGAGTLSNGNLQLGGISSPGTGRCNGTMAVSSGKWYYELTLLTAASYTSAGIGQGDITNQYPGQDALSYAYTCEQGTTISNGNQPSYGPTLASGDILQVAFDLDNNKIFFGKNNTWMASSNPATGANPALTLASGTYRPITRPYSSTGLVFANFGACGFKYTPPTGYKALCTQNLTDPTIENSSTAFDARTYNGDTTTSQSGFEFSPDFLWLKSRSNTDTHFLFDTVRGVQKYLSTSNSNAEGTQSASITSFDSDGFSYGSWGPLKNSSMIAWCWDAGSSTTSNTDGSITSQVRANPSAGISIVKYTGNGSSSATVGHGLNAQLAMLIHKRLDNTGSWKIKHTSMNTDHQLLFDTAGSVDVTGAHGGGMADLSSTSTFGFAQGLTNVDNVNGNNVDYINYCFAPVEGFSAFGSYTGTGTSDNSAPFIHTGFLPRWIMIKHYTGSGNNWIIYDTARNTSNVAGKQLYPNLTAAEADAALADYARKARFCFKRV